MKEKVNIWEKKKKRHHTEFIIDSIGSQLFKKKRTIELYKKLCMNE